MSYLVKVQNFFLKNDPERYYLAKRITRTFRGDEDAVMARLEEIYAKGGCLLYTSPSPRDRTRSRMPSSA